MKNILLFFALFFVETALKAQSTVGLVAHWNMNGGTADVSGNGHTGHPSNVTPVAGMDGLPNTAYYFNGSTSIITAPHMPDLNLTNYSICAIVNVKGFYSGLCQANCIVARGKPSGPGGYWLYFDDNAFDGGSCSALDSAKDGFKSAFGGGTAPASDWQYLPGIVKDKWYKVVATWNGTSWKIYSDDTLRVTVLNTGPTPTTSSDSISIGKNLYETGTGYPYQFKGIIDDIRIYNRVLSDTEIVHYGDTCGSIVAEPANAMATIGGTVTYTVSTSIQTPAYQWQQDAGTGYVNLSNSGPYSGVTTNTLTITGVTAALNSYHYKCLVSNSWGCADTSVGALLNAPVSVNNALLADMVFVFPNPSHNNVVVQLPYAPKNGTIQVINEVGQVVSAQEIAGSIAMFDLSQLPARMYLLRISCDGQVVYKRVLRN